MGALDDAVGERIRLTLDEPTELDHITVLQAPGNRHISEAKVTVGDESFTVDLGPESLTATGPDHHLPEHHGDRPWRSRWRPPIPAGWRATTTTRGVGFAEIQVPGVEVSESLRLPTDLLAATGTDDLSHPLYVVVTRNRTDPQNPGRPDPEPSIHRVVTLPSGRSFTLIGDVRLDSSATAEQIAALVGGTDGTLVSASSWLPGDLADRGRAAFDGDPATWWTPRIGDDAGAWVQIAGTTVVSPTELTVTFAADGRHSTPSQLSVQADGATVATVDVPDEPAGAFGTTRSVSIPIPAGVAAASWRITVDDIHPNLTTPWIGGGDYALPVGIAVGRRSRGSPPLRSPPPSTPAVAPTSSVSTGSRCLLG